MCLMLLTWLIGEISSFYRNGTINYVDLDASGQASAIQLKTALSQPRGLAINPFDRLDNNSHAYLCKSAKVFICLFGCLLTCMHSTNI